MIVDSFQNDPLGTSTPKDHPGKITDIIKGRESYHREKSPSPIPGDESDSTDEECEKTKLIRRRTIPEGTAPSRPKRTNIENPVADKGLNNFSACVAIGSVSLLVIGGLLYSLYGETLHGETHITIKDLKLSFPSQAVDLWNAIESGVTDVVDYKRPTVLFLIHKHMDNETISHLLGNLTKYISCIINKDCGVSPITLTNHNLNSPELIADYGIVLTTYKPQLEKATTMVIRNIDLVSGSVARAFHSICDQYTPLVGKSVVIFTMGVDDFPPRDLQLVERVLKNNWSNLDIDVYAPLISRMTNIVLRIEPELNSDE